MKKNISENKKKKLILNAVITALSLAVLIFLNVLKIKTSLSQIVRVGCLIAMLWVLYSLSKGGE
jgi:hypothetical protein